MVAHSGLEPATFIHVIQVFWFFFSSEPCRQICRVGFRLLLGTRKMRLPYSDRSLRPCVRPSFRLERNGYVHFAVPIGATFTKLAPTVHLYMIY